MIISWLYVVGWTGLKQYFDHFGLFLAFFLGTIKTGLKLYSGLQKVGTAGTAGTGGTGKQSDLRGRSVYFLHIPIHLWGEICDLFLLWYGKQNIFCSPVMLYKYKFNPFIPIIVMILERCILSKQIGVILGHFGLIRPISHFDKSIAHLWWTTIIRPAVLEIWQWCLLGGFRRFFERHVHIRNFTDRIRTLEEPEIDQKKFPIN